MDLVIHNSQVAWRLDLRWSRIIPAAVEQVKHHLLDRGSHPEGLAAGGLHRIKSVKRHVLQDAHMLPAPVRIAVLQLLSDAPEGLRKIPVLEWGSVAQCARLSLQRGQVMPEIEDRLASAKIPLAPVTWPSETITMRSAYTRICTLGPTCSPLTL